MSINQLKKDLEVIRRAITPREQSKAEDILELLKVYEELTGKMSAVEQHEIAKEAAEQIIKDQAAEIIRKYQEQNKVHMENNRLLIEDSTKQEAQVLDYVSTSLIDTRINRSLH